MLSFADLLLFIVLAIGKHSKALEESPPSILTMELRNDGFHREIHYNLEEKQFPAVFSNECRYLIRQEIPAAMYVCVDQLNNLKRLGKLNAIYPEFVDIELFSESAQSFVVFLFLEPLKYSQDVVLPVHYRYHKPDESGVISVSVPEPKVYINCPREVYELPPNNSTNEQEWEGKTMLIENEEWLLLKEILHVKSALNVNIPRGQPSNYPWISSITILLSWLTMIYFIKVTTNIPQYFQMTKDNS